MDMGARIFKWLVRRYAATLSGQWSTRLRQFGELLGRGRRALAKGGAGRFAACLMLATLACGAAAGEAEAQSGGPPPNIVFIMGDDLGWADNSLAHNQLLAAQRGDTDTFFETPNLERLAQRGINFNQAYMAATNCSPSRVSLLNGQFTARHRTTTISNSDDFYGGGYNVRDYERNLAASTTTIAEALRSAGYRTSHLGKWHVGEDGNAAADPLNHGFDNNVGGGHWGGPQPDDRYFADNNGGYDWNSTIPANGNSGQYLTDRLGVEATNAIQAAHDADEPFFINFWQYAPHTPLQAPGNLVNKYQNKLNNGSYAKFQQPDVDATDVATYAAMVESIDQSLGAVLDKLDALGIEDETLVVFTSDHGAFNQDQSFYRAPQNMNGPLREGKGAPYEGGVRVPMVVAGAGVGAADVESDAVISAVDFYPTLLNLAGASGSGNATLDGEDITGVLSNPSAGFDRAAPLVWHTPHNFNLRGTSEAGGELGNHSIIRDGDFKLLRFYRQTGLTEVELYNIANDIGETNDLAGTNPAKVAELEQKLDDYLAGVDAQMPTGHELDRTGPPPLWASLFDHEPNRDDLNDSVSGQFGDLETLTLLEDASDAGSESRVIDQQLLLGGAGTAWMAPAHDFVDQKLVDAGGFKLSFEVNPIVGGDGTSERWAAVSFGHNAQSVTGDSSTLKFNGQNGDGEFIVVHEDSAFGIILADDGTLAIRDDGVPVDLNGAAEGDRAVFDPFAAGNDKTYKVELFVELTSFDPGEPGLISAFVDGVQIDLNGVDVPGLDYSFTWNGGSNYLNFEGSPINGATNPTMFDQIVVEQIPEPGTLSLLGLGAATLLRRRRSVGANPGLKERPRA